METGNSPNDLRGRENDSCASESGSNVSSTKDVLPYGLEVENASTPAPNTQSEEESSSVPNNLRSIRKAKSARHKSAALPRRKTNASIGKNLLQTIGETTRHAASGPDTPRFTVTQAVTEASDPNLIGEATRHAANDPSTQAVTEASDPNLIGEATRHAANGPGTQAITAASDPNLNINLHSSVQQYQPAQYINPVWNQGPQVFRHSLVLPALTSTYSCPYRQSDQGLFSLTYHFEQQFTATLNHSVLENQSVVPQEKASTPLDTHSQRLHEQMPLNAFQSEPEQYSVPFLQPVPMTESCASYQRQLSLFNQSPLSHQNNIEHYNPDLPVYIYQVSTYEHLSLCPNFVRTMSQNSWHLHPCQDGFAVQNVPLAFPIMYIPPDNLQDPEISQSELPQNSQQSQVSIPDNFAQGQDQPSLDNSGDKGDKFTNQGRDTDERMQDHGGMAQNDPSTQQNELSDNSQKEGPQIYVPNFKKDEDSRNTSLSFFAEEIFEKDEKQACQSDNQMESGAAPTHTTFADEGHLPSSVEDERKVDQSAQTEQTSEALLKEFSKLEQQSEATEYVPSSANSQNVAPSNCSHIVLPPCLKKKTFNFKGGNKSSKEKFCYSILQHMEALERYENWHDYEKAKRTIKGDIASVPTFPHKPYVFLHLEPGQSIQLSLSESSARSYENLFLPLCPGMHELVESSYTSRPSRFQRPFAFEDRENEARLILSIPDTDLNEVIFTRPIAVVPNSAEHDRNCGRGIQKHGSQLWLPQAESTCLDPVSSDDEDDAAAEDFDKETAMDVIVTRLLHDSQSGFADLEGEQAALTMCHSGRHFGLYYYAHMDVGAKEVERRQPLSRKRELQLKKNQKSAAKKVARYIPFININANRINSSKVFNSIFDSRKHQVNTRGQRKALSNHMKRVSHRFLVYEGWLRQQCLRHRSDSGEEAATTKKEMEKETEDKHSGWEVITREPESFEEGTGLECDQANTYAQITNYSIVDEEEKKGSPGAYVVVTGKHIGQAFFPGVLKFETGESSDSEYETGLCPELTLPLDLAISKEKNRETEDIDNNSRSFDAAKTKSVDNESDMIKRATNDDSDYKTKHVSSSTCVSKNCDDAESNMLLKVPKPCRPTNENETKQIDCLDANEDESTLNGSYTKDGKRIQQNLNIDKSKSNELEENDSVRKSCGKKPSHETTPSPNNKRSEEVFESKQKILSSPEESFPLFDEHNKNLFCAADMNSDQELLLKEKHHPDNEENEIVQLPGEDADIDKKYFVEAESDNCLNNENTDKTQKEMYVRNLSINDEVIEGENESDRPRHNKQIYIKDKTSAKSSIDESNTLKIQEEVRVNKTLNQQKHPVVKKKKAKKKMMRKKTAQMKNSQNGYETALQDDALETVEFQNSEEETEVGQSKQNHESVEALPTNIGTENYQGNDNKINDMAALHPTPSLASTVDEVQLQKRIPVENEGGHSIYSNHHGALLPKNLAAENLRAKFHKSDAKKTKIDQSKHGHQNGAAFPRNKATEKHSNFDSDEQDEAASKMSKLIMTSALAVDEAESRQSLGRESEVHKVKQSEQIEAVLPSNSAAGKDSNSDNTTQVVAVSEVNQFGVTSPASQIQRIASQKSLGEETDVSQRKRNISEAAILSSERYSGPNTSVEAALGISTPLPSQDINVATNNLQVIKNTNSTGDDGKSPALTEKSGAGPILQGKPLLYINQPQGSESETTRPEENFGEAAVRQNTHADGKNENHLRESKATEQKMVNVSTNNILKENTSLLQNFSARNFPKDNSLVRDEINNLAKMIFDQTDDISNNSLSSPIAGLSDIGKDSVVQSSKTIESQTDHLSELEMRLPRSSGELKAKNLKDVKIKTESKAIENDSQENNGYNTQRKNLYRANSEPSIPRTYSSSPFKENITEGHVYKERANLCQETRNVGKGQVINQKLPNAQKSANRYEKEQELPNIRFEKVEPRFEQSNTKMESDGQKIAASYGARLKQRHQKDGHVQFSTVSNTEETNTVKDDLTMPELAHTTESQVRNNHEILMAKRKRKVLVEGRTNYPGHKEHTSTKSQLNDESIGHHTMLPEIHDRDLESERSRRKNKISGSEIFNIANMNTSSSPKDEGIGVTPQGLDMSDNTNDRSAVSLDSGSSMKEEQSAVDQLSYLSAMNHKTEKLNLDYTISLRLTNAAKLFLKMPLRQEIEARSLHRQLSTHSVSHLAAAGIPEDGEYGMHKTIFKFPITVENVIKFVALAVSEWAQQVILIRRGAENNFEQSERDKKVGVTPNKNVKIPWFQNRREVTAQFQERMKSDLNINAKEFQPKLILPSSAANVGSNWSGAQKNMKISQLNNMKKAFKDVNSERDRMTSGDVLEGRNTAAQNIAERHMENQSSTDPSLQEQKSPQSIEKPIDEATFSILCNNFSSMAVGNGLSHKIGKHVVFTVLNLPNRMAPLQANTNESGEVTSEKNDISDNHFRQASYKFKPTCFPNTMKKLCEIAILKTQILDDVTSGSSVAVKGQEIQPEFTFIKGQHRLEDIENSLLENFAAEKQDMKARDFSHDIIVPNCPTQNLAASYLPHDTESQMTTGETLDEIKDDLSTTTNQNMNRRTEPYDPSFPRYPMHSHDADNSMVFHQLSETALTSFHQLGLDVWSQNQGQDYHTLQTREELRLSSNSASVFQPPSEKQSGIGLIPRLEENIQNVLPQDIFPDFSNQSLLPSQSIYESEQWLSLVQHIWSSSNYITEQPDFIHSQSYSRRQGSRLLMYQRNRYQRDSEQTKQHVQQERNMVGENYRQERDVQYPQISNKFVSNMHETQQLHSHQLQRNPGVNVWQQNEQGQPLAQHIWSSSNYITEQPDSIHSQSHSRRQGSQVPMDQTNRYQRDSEQTKQYMQQERNMVGENYRQERGAQYPQISNKFVSNMHETQQLHSHQLQRNPGVNVWQQNEQGQPLAEHIWSSSNYITEQPDFIHSQSHSRRQGSQLPMDQTNRYQRDSEQTKQYMQQKGNAGLMAKQREGVTDMTQGIDGYLTHLSGVRQQSNTALHHFTQTHQYSLKEINPNSTQHEESHSSLQQYQPRANVVKTRYQANAEHFLNRSSQLNVFNHQNQDRMEPLQLTPLSRTSNNTQYNFSGNRNPIISNQSLMHSGQPMEQRSTHAMSHLTPFNTSGVQEKSAATKGAHQILDRTEQLQPISLARTSNNTQYYSASSTQSMISNQSSTHSGQPSEESLTLAMPHSTPYNASGVQEMSFAAQGARPRTPRNQMNQHRPAPHGHQRGAQERAISSNIDSYLQEERNSEGEIPGQQNQTRDHQSWQNRSGYVQNSQITSPRRQRQFYRRQNEASLPSFRGNHTMNRINQPQREPHKSERKQKSRKP
ncbi:hypothetical protein PoB_001069500 [Plakobranchus ocellatus]|uniref:Uncharacterized protein n=1 Tax=Plakobranchus ocellatus TaxID=259542 RepID=A0AAV3YP01_9GAST|nr:hypothetical protein PoB_001069500 [Plakobranchus ocellatus]